MLEFVVDGTILAYGFEVVQRMVCRWQTFPVSVLSLSPNRTVIGPGEQVPIFDFVSTDVGWLSGYDLVSNIGGGLIVVANQ